MKTEYYIHNNMCAYARLCKVVNNVFYRYDEVFEQWGEVPHYTHQCKEGIFPIDMHFEKLTEEEAFRHILEN